MKNKNNILIIGSLLLTLAASGPQIGTRVRPIERKGVDLVIALDTSTSMDAEDVTPSRLEKSKLEIGKLIRNLKGDRVAVIVFAGTSHLYLPLTTDYEAALLFLNEIDSKMIPTQGTVLSKAMLKALESFSNEIHFDQLDNFDLWILDSLDKTIIEVNKSFDKFFDVSLSFKNNSISSNLLIELEIVFQLVRVPPNHLLFT